MRTVAGGGISVDGDMQRCAENIAVAAANRPRYASVWLITFALLVAPGGCEAFGANTGSLSIEHASLLAFPEADCTKVRVYLKNAGRFPVFIETVQVGERTLDLDPVKDAPPSDGKAASTVHDDQGAPRRTDGNLQWRRALPDPVPPDGIADVTVSLWGIVKDVPIRITARDGQTLELQAKETPEKLRLSQITFDPADPNKIYVYCENKSDKDVAIDRLLVNAEKAEISRSIPVGNKIEAGKKGCFIVRPKQKMVWGQYAGVGIVGKTGEKVMAVVRVINYFPVGSWDGDTRPEMFFDSADLRKPMPGGNTAPPINAPLGVPLDGAFGRPFKAYYDNGNPFRVGASWEDNARKIIRTMSALNDQDASTPFYTGFGLPITEAYAFFGGLPDLVFLNPYTILFRAAGPEESGRLIRHARTWVDPRPIISVPEAFDDPAKVGRDLTPDEVSFAMWNEVAEGAKGVRYYQRRRYPSGRGYADMPGVEARIARDALSLQLLKPFLRVGDTFDLAASNKDKVVCKSVLCGEKGVVVIALNRDFTGKMETPSQWRSAADIGVTVTIPNGQHVGQVLEVNQGFRPVQFTQGDGRVEFVMPSIRTARVYLVRFQQEGGPVPGSLAARKSQYVAAGSDKGQTTMTAEYVSTLLANHREEAYRIAVPLLEPGLQLDDGSVVKIGLELDALRGSLLRKLAAIKERVSSLDARKQGAIRAALEKAHEPLGQTDE